jgi:hypothetical protein
VHYELVVAPHERHDVVLREELVREQRLPHQISFCVTVPDEPGPTRSQCSRALRPAARPMIQWYSSRNFLKPDT